MYNQKLLETIEERFNKVQLDLCTDFDEEKDVYSYIAAILYDKSYDECCSFVDGKPNPFGMKLRGNVKQLLLPIIVECGGITKEN